jgi:hypothetical protein
MMKKLWKCIFATALAMMSLLPSAQLKPIEVKAAATFTASNLSGTAYAELNTTTGELVFKRTAAEEAVPESTSTVLVYTGFESVSYTSYSKVPWYSKRTSVRDQQK